MFFVLNKRKISSYLISLGTVVMLFAVAIFVNNNTKLDNATLSKQTAAEEAVVPILKKETEKKEIALSINCSKNVENIDSILDSLSKMKVKATFFVTGEVASNNKEQIKKISDNGHEIGNLCNEYISLKNKSEEIIEEQIVRGMQEIEAITSIKVKNLRIPYGEYNNLILKKAKENNLKTILWNIDSLDYNGLNEDEMWERINENLSPGSILLMHNDAKYTPNSIENIIHKIQQQEYQIKTVSELLE